MPLELLLILVVGGISAIALLLHLTGRSRSSVMTDTQARQAWLRQFPESPIAKLTLAEDGQAALIQPEDGRAPLGLVWSFGADTVARFLEHVEVDKAKQGLHLNLADFSAPGVQLHLNDSEAEQWQRLIEGQPATAPAAKEV
ncbi:hypothetical protein ACFP4H_08550 [Pseudophaeobacter arcticus]|uniref:hypothetical protein n=1 Tax=Pseudophaeobacter arcticus TaxID=385492 RepID=UPI0003FFE8A5|nr:hypothetical protein [Pseudophaeobacter arcticus]